MQLLTSFMSLSKLVDSLSLSFYNYKMEIIILMFYDCHEHYMGIHSQCLAEGLASYMLVLSMLVTCIRSIMNLVGSHTV